MKTKSRHIIFTLLKTKDQEKNLENIQKTKVKKKQTNIIHRVTRVTILMTTDLLE